MRFLCLLLALFLLGSLAAPAYGKIRKTCAPVGYCSPKCNVLDLKYSSADCKYSCCIPNPWKGK